MYNYFFEHDSYLELVNIRCTEKISGSK